jgi:MoxR-like ATPase
MTPPPVAKPTHDSDAVAAVARLTEARQKLKAEIAKAVVGQDAVVDALLTALLCRGHVLLLGVPGIGKTLMARTVCRRRRPRLERLAQNAALCSSGAPAGRIPD